jgi:hypothetical protein
MYKLVCFCICLTACGGAVALDETPDATSDSATCGPVQGASYLISYAQTGGDCSPIMPSILTFGEAAITPTKCRWEKFQNCISDNVDCKYIIDNISYDATMNIYWSVSGTSGGGILNQTLTDTDGHSCNGIYDLTLTKTDQKIP